MFDVSHILDTIKKGRPDWIKTAETEFNKYNTHINGVDSARYLDQVIKFENDEQYKARQNFLTSNRYVFENIRRPIDKVFSATGGTSFYPKKNNKLIIEKSSNIRHGYSIKKWIQNIQANRLYCDPNGLVFFEWNEKETYPTVKEITCIYNYQTSGRNVEWVLFNPYQDKEGIEYYRFVDDKYDYLIAKKGESISIVKEKTFANPFSRCPAIVNSNIIHFELNRKDSPFAPIIELADHYLRTNSIKNIYEYLHGYPIFWAYSQPCKKCLGEGTVNINDEICKCTSCGGSGNTLKKDVTDGIILKTIKSTDQAKIAPDVAGYVQPDLETWREQRTELDWLWNIMHYTVWGTSYQRDQETATATFIDAQPVNDRLFQFSEIFEDMEQKMTELIALFYNKTSNDVSINWGKRFLLERPDALWNKYIDSKSKAANLTTLNYLLSQFYQTEFANDKQSLLVYQKLMKIEPFIHNTVKEVKDDGITGIELARKQYFNEWLGTLQDGHIFTTDENKLRDELTSYAESKMVVDENEETTEDLSEDENQEENISNSEDSEMSNDKENINEVQ